MPGSDDGRDMPNGDEGKKTDESLEGLAPVDIKGVEQVSEELYGKDVDKQRGYENALRKGRELFKGELSPETKSTVEEILKAGKQEDIVELMKYSLDLYEKYKGDNKIIEEEYDAMTKMVEFQKKEGEEPSETVVKVGNLIKERLSKTKQGK